MSLQRVGILIAIIFLLTACNSEITFEGSVIDEEFPVPTKAKVADKNEIENEEMEESVRYNWKHASEVDSIHNSYIQAITAYGWEERRGEEQGTLRIFEKGMKVISISTHYGYFILSKQIENAQ